MKLIKKSAKLLVAIVILIVVGNIYSEFERSNEDRAYMVLSIKFPNRLDRGTIIKKYPESVCDSDLDDAKQTTMKNCPQCMIAEHYCAPNYDSKYDGIFEDKPIRYNYISVDAKYPERHIIRFSDSSLYNKLCDVMKADYPDKVKCIFKNKRG